MWSYLQDILTVDECDILTAKLRAANITQRVLRDRLYDLVDSLEDEFPYQERVIVLGVGIAHPSYQSMDWYEANAYSKAQWRAYDVARKHEQTMWEIASIL